MKNQLYFILYINCIGDTKDPSSWKVEFDKFKYLWFVFILVNIQAIVTCKNWYIVNCKNNPPSCDLQSMPFQVQYRFKSLSKWNQEIYTSIQNRGVFILGDALSLESLQRFMMD